MSDSRTLAVLLGAAIVIGALFAPWYALDFGPVARDAIASQTDQLPGAFGAFAKQLVTMLPDHIEANAWTAFERTDVVLLAAAIAAAFSAMLNRLDVAALAGGVVLGTTVWALADPPIPSELLSLQWGAWLTLAGGLLIVVASRVPARRERAPDSPPAGYAPPPVTPAPVGGRSQRPEIPPWG
jgi:hypothetical protein